jgi:hydroxymethylbilane synthase
MTRFLTRRLPARRNRFEPFVFHMNTKHNGTLVIGTRGSPLAMAQTGIIKELLRVAWPSLDVRVKTIKTSGDLFQGISMTKGAGKGLFTKEIEEQLLDGTIDVAVHSMKDLPTELPSGLILGASPAREDARDVLIAKRPFTVDTLPTGAVVASSSIRRQAQLLARRPDLHVIEIRGNLDTRLRKLGEHDDWHATMLASAGLNRLGMRDQWPGYHWEALGFDVMLPAVGQGAIGLEMRSDDEAAGNVLAAINHEPTFLCTAAERSFLRAIGGGCQMPYAAHATMDDGKITLTAARFDPDGSNMRRVTVTGASTQSVSIGEQAATQLAANG